MDFSGQLAAIAEELDCNFTLQERPVPIDQVFAVDGLLPGFMRRADQLSSFCLGYELGVTYEKSENAMLGVRAVLDDDTPMSLRLLCVTDVLIEIMQNAPNHETTPLDELMTE